MGLLVLPFIPYPALYATTVTSRYSLSILRCSRGISGYSLAAEQNGRNLKIKLGVSGGYKALS